MATRMPVEKSISLGGGNQTQRTRTLANLMWPVHLATYRGAML
jgi:hypothetical protein